MPPFEISSPQSADLQSQRMSAVSVPKAQKRPASKRKTVEIAYYYAKSVEQI
jgi:hypothetical protein